MQPLSRTGAVLVTAMFIAALGSPHEAQAEDKLYTLSELDVVEKVVPDYPRRARQGGFDGWVKLEFTVTPEGRVSEAQVVDSSSRIFHRDALVALQRWRFAPVAVGGHPAPVRAQLRFNFQGD